MVIYTISLEEPLTEAGSLLSKSAGWIAPCLTAFMLLNNSRARAYTRRKVEDWWLARWLALRVVCVLLDPVLAVEPPVTGTTDIAPYLDQEEQAASRMSEADPALNSIC